MFGWLKRLFETEKIDPPPKPCAVKISPELRESISQAFEDRNRGSDSEARIVPPVAERVQTVLDQWKDDQGVYMPEEVRNLIVEIEDVLDDPY